MNEEVELLASIVQDLEVPKEKVDEFISQMQLNGSLEYAINALKTIENKRYFGLFYPYFYSIVAFLNSSEGLEKLHKVYNDEFEFDEDDISLIWDLYEIKDFRESEIPASSNPKGRSGIYWIVRPIALVSNIFKKVSKSFKEEYINQLKDMN